VLSKQTNGPKDCSAGFSAVHQAPINTASGCGLQKAFIAEGAGISCQAERLPDHVVLQSKKHSNKSQRARRIAPPGGRDMQIDVIM